MPNNEFIIKIMSKGYRFPSITAYNRLECNPRTADFDRSIKAEVRDPLWMLTRQWQFGEFQGEDAASPVTAQILGSHTEMDRVAFPRDRVFTYDEKIPLETTVEREKPAPNLFLAVQMGRFFIKMMRAESLENHLDKFLSKYPLNFTVDKNDIEGRQLVQSVEGAVFDGYILYEDIIVTDDGETRTRFQLWLDTFADSDIAAADKIKFEEAANAFRDWFQRNYSQPGSENDSAWLPSQLEYQFAVASPVKDKHQASLTADQYHEGRLDWYSFDIDPNKKIPMVPEPEEGVVNEENFVSFIPAPISFKGMPLARFWTMEESRTDFGKIDTTTTGLLHLLFAEFGLIYSNDWFMLPYPMSINTLCEIKGIVITDVFGRHVLIRPAGRGPQSDWQRWAMFYHTGKNSDTFDTNLFYLPPALPKAMGGEPLEKVSFLRDEMANMVWAVENIVPSQAGVGVSGKEMALKEEEPASFVPVGEEAKIRYVLGTTVPENWIPFIPVHMEGSDTEIRLQRAKMPGSKGALGRILTEVEAPYFVNEEEAPRAGIIVKRNYQRARWLNGKTLLWIGRYKEAGRGEGWSNLKFDRIEPI